MRALMLGLAEACLAVLANKFRTALTMLGVTIGVMAIVAVVSVGDSGKKRVLDEIEKVAQPTMFWVYPEWEFIQKLEEENRPIRYIKYEEFEHLKEVCRAYGDLFARLTNRARVRFLDREIATSVSGVNREYFDAMGLWVGEGRMFTERDEAVHSRVCVIGNEVKETLFPFGPAVGKVVRAGDQRYTVIGVLAKRGTSYFDFRNYDDNLYVPYSTMQHREPQKRDLMWFSGMARSPELIDTMRGRIHQSFVEFGLPREQMGSRTMAEELEGFEMVSLILKVMVSGVSAISLFVGGLGIMNIMLVTVKERTREIGLRKALGANSGAIRFQFFVESTLMSTLGGAIGAVLGVLITHGVNKFTGFPSLISHGAIFWGMFFAFLVGILFGIYPAHKAASLDPAEALRYE